MIEYKEFSYHSFQDQMEIHATIAYPQQEPIGIVQLIHGMAEYRGRYQGLMQFLANQGFIVLIHDHRGHGDSIKTEQDLGYFHEQKAEFIVEDAHQLTYYMKKQYPDLPYILFGHSMGSLVARAYTKKYDYELDGLIICGSPSKNPLALLGKGLVIIMEKIKGDRYRSPLIQKMAFGKHNKKFAKHTSPNSWICSVEEEVQKYDEHSKCGYTFTLNGFRNLFTLMSDVYQDDHWLLQNPKLPILFIAGSDDPCIISEEKFKEAVNFMIQLGYHDMRSKLYQGKRHEILNESNKEEVYRDILSFIERAITQRSK